jgi:hypothetical protein
MKDNFGPLGKAICGGMCVIGVVSATAEVIHLDGEPPVARHVSRHEVVPIRDETHREFAGWAGIALGSVEVASTASHVLLSSVRYVGAAGEPRVAETHFTSL